MKLITRQSRANDVSIRWKYQYRIDIGDIQKRLDALGKEKNPDDVDKIIGNVSWTAIPPCTECGKENPDFVVMVGEEPDYESATAWLCAECIKKAMRLSNRKETTDEV